jgi:hypothetical protein
MKALMNMAMVSCKQAAFFQTKKSFNDLSLIDGLKLKMHERVCGACKTLGKDSALIDEAVNKILAQKNLQNLKLSEEQRNRILEAIK